MDSARGVTRRRIIGTGVASGIALPVLAACGGDEGRGGGAGVPSEGTELTTTSEVPVGGGVILGGVVVTQPSEGEFRAFSSTCTHQACTVSSVTDGRIGCGCHGSAFSVVDGSVENGPATTPLPEIPVDVQGDRIVRA